MAFSRRSDNLALALHHSRIVSEAIWAAGGIPREFNTIAIDDGIAMGHDGDSQREHPQCRKVGHLDAAFLASYTMRYNRNRRRDAKVTETQWGEKQIWLGGINDPASIKTGLSPILAIVNEPSQVLSRAFLAVSLNFSKHGTFIVRRAEGKRDS